MNPYTPTPETEALIKDMDEAVCIEGPTTENISVFIDFARKLERERNALKTECTMLQLERSQAVRELDQLRKERDIELERSTHYRDEWQKAQQKLQLCDQLRKVCDELAKAIQEGLNHGYGLRIGEEALDAYNQLPHVKEKTK